MLATLGRPSSSIQAAERSRGIGIRSRGVGAGVGAGSTGTANWQLGVDQDTQATYLAKTLEIVRSEWSYVKRVYWYRELADNNTSQSSGYGLILPNGTPKPALTQIPSIYAG